MKNVLTLTTVLTTLTLATGCTGSAAGATASGAQTTGVITGTVSYRERIALSPSAEVTVRLEDISLADAPAKLLVENVMTNVGQVPVPFKLQFDPALIDARSNYTVRASIRDEGRLLFTSDTVMPVLTQGNGNTADIWLVRANGTAQMTLTGTTWQLSAIEGKPLTVAPNRLPPDLVLLEDPAVARGYSGCNRFNGNWKQEGNQLTFGQMAMTMMACVDGMDVEQQYMQALSAPVRYGLDGNTLRFYSGDKEILMFRAAQ